MYVHAHADTDKDFLHTPMKCWISYMWMKMKKCIIRSYPVYKRSFTLTYTEQMRHLD